MGLTPPWGKEDSLLCPMSASHWLQAVRVGWRSRAYSPKAVLLGAAVSHSAAKPTATGQLEDSLLKGSYLGRVPPTSQSIALDTMGDKEGEKGTAQQTFMV